jgi:hypothetical protein
VYLVVYIGGAILVGLVLGRVLGRFALVAGLFITALGFAPFTALYIYTDILGVRGDHSAAGMLSTIIFILVVPVGLVTCATGALRRH